MDNKKSLDSIHIRISKSFRDEIDKIISERRVNGIDKRDLSRPEITKLLTIDPKFIELKHSLINKKLDDLSVPSLRLNLFARNRRGGLSIAQAFLPILIFIFIAFAAFLFMAAFMYGYNLMTNSLLDLPSGIGTLPSVNLTDAVQSTFVQINSSLVIFRVASILLIFAGLCAVLIANWSIKIHPAWFIAYFFLMIAAVVLSVYISNTYEDLTQMGALKDTLLSFKGANHVINNLPVYVTVTGFIGAILLFMGIQRQQSQGGDLV